MCSAISRPACLSSVGERLCLVHQLIGGTPLLLRRREDGGQQHTDPHRDGTGGERVALGLLPHRVGRFLERGDGATRRVSDAAGGIGDGAGDRSRCPTPSP